MRTLLAAATMAAALAASGAARAEPFTILVYETEADFALRSDTTAAGQAYWAAWGRFAEVLQTSGAIRGGAPLQLPSQGRTLRAGAPTAGAAGSMAAGGLHLGGYFSVEAPSLDAAAALAAQAPSVSRGGAAEVRATYPTPGMSN